MNYSQWRGDEVPATLMSAYYDPAFSVIWARKED